MTQKNIVDNFTNQLTKEVSPRAKSLIITFVGDVVYPFGGTIWLGSLIKFMEDFGLNDKLTRTSIFRLTKEGWLSAKKIGRESYYSLSDLAIDRFKKAHYRVYAYDAYSEEKNKDWLTLLTHHLEDKKETELSKKLKKEGFASPSKHLYLHPNYDFEHLKNLLIKDDLQNSVFLLKGSLKMPINKELVKQSISSYWDMGKVEEKYEAFLTRFRKVYTLKTPLANFSPRQSFILKTLLIHEYRRALLNDPNLGDDMVNIDWLGKSTASLVEDIYLNIESNANEYIKENFINMGRSEPKLSDFYYNRFGGIANTLRQEKGE